MAKDSKFLDVDVSRLNELMRGIEEEIGPDGLKKALQWTFRRVPGHIRRIMPSIIVKDYHVQKRYVARTIQKGTLTKDAKGVTCIIPVIDPRGIVGGSNYTLAAGARRMAERRLHMSNKQKKGKPYRIKFKMKQQKVSVLPKRMPEARRSSYGDQPPFVTPRASKTNGLVFTRKFAKRALPIIRVGGIGVPQMPLNESEKPVQHDIAQYIEKELTLNYEEILRRIREQEKAARK